MDVFLCFQLLPWSWWFIARRSVTETIPMIGCDTPVTG
jgi:hypothetical protein